MRSPDPNVDVEDVRPEAEFSRFFEIEHRGQVRRAALMLGEVNVAEDVVHDAFAEVWQRWRVLTDPGSYLDRCVLNGCRDAASGRARSRHRFERMIASHRESTEPIEVRRVCWVDALESSVLGANRSSGMREWFGEQRFCDQS